MREAAVRVASRNRVTHAMTFTVDEADKEVQQAVVTLLGALH